jgi:hypothetical protein
MSGYAGVPLEHHLKLIQNLESSKADCLTMLGFHLHVKHESSPKVVTSDIPPSMFAEEGVSVPVYDCH